MARIHSCSARLVQPLAEIWECARDAAGATETPAQLSGLHWLPAHVPGTFAASLRSAGAWDGEAPLELDASDIWYRTRFDGGGDEILHFDGLATVAEVWLNGQLLFTSDNMFLPRRIAVRTEVSNALHICFRSLRQHLGGQRGRARWRPRLATPSSLRFARTTLLGRMPGWCPAIHPVGPWRPVLRERKTGAPAIESVDVRTAVDGHEGRVVIRAELNQPADVEAVAECAGQTAHLQRTAPHVLQGTVTVPDPALWWPHTHGAPVLHPLRLRLGQTVCDLGQIGFRTITVDRGPDGKGFALRVNGTPVFCRGACWTSPDIVTLAGDAAAYRPGLTAMRDAGMNMVRIGGTMLYEADPFYDLCDELGLLVWQDAMLANFDYPATDAFRGSLAAELTSFLDRTQANPSLTVFCGGSEVLQQATMLGLPEDKIDAWLYTNFIPDLLQQVRSDLVYVTNSPSGGDWPFQPDAGVSHYYGVGAYLRPLDDARRANIRFASECLAVSNVPDHHAVRRMDIATTTDPRWKQGVPRDPGAAWDFEDVREHYLRQFFAVDPAHLRWTDFARYLELSRAVSCLLMQHVLGEWRRTGSGCDGAIIWHLQDIAPGAGWGVLDVHGRPKAAWHAIRQICRPQQVIITDEGLNGLHLHVLNETPRELRATLRLTCLRNGRHPVRQAALPITLAAHGAVCHHSAGMLREFFDITHTYRFGPPNHDVTIASLHDAEDDTLISEAFHFPGGALPQRDLDLTTRVEHEGGDAWLLAVATQSFAQFLHVEDENFIAEDDWVHLPPGRERRIRLRRSAGSGAAALPNGEVHALNMNRIIRYMVPT
jgi:beta-mannosidase